MSEQQVLYEQQPTGRIRYVGFDMDGTIRDSSAEYTYLFGQLMHGKYGIDPSEAGVHFVNTAGQPTPEQISTLLKKHGITISFDEAFEEGNRVASFLGEHSDAPSFAEVPDTLKDLKERGYRIFVSSGQQEEVVRGYLEKSGLISYVDFFAGIRPEEPEFEKGEPHFQEAARHFGVPFDIFVKEVVFIGDTPTDMKVANESGITAIARSGINTEEDLLGSGAKLVLPEFSNLSVVLLTL